MSLEPGQDDENFELSIHVHLHTNPETVISSAQSPCLRFLQMRKHRILKRTDLGDHSQLSVQPYYVFEQDFIHNHDLDPQEHAEEGALQSDFKRDTPGKQRYWSSSRRLGFQNGTPAFTTSHRGPTCDLDLVANQLTAPKPAMPANSVSLHAPGKDSRHRIHQERETCWSQDWCIKAVLIRDCY